jgi:hypothetical protein
MVVDSAFRDLIRFVNKHRFVGGFSGCLVRGYDMVKMFKGDVRGVFVGACCAAVITCGVSEGVNESINVINKFQFNCGLEGYDKKIVGQVEELVVNMFNDDKAIDSLVEILCSSAVDSYFATSVAYDFGNFWTEKRDSPNDRNKYLRYQALLNGIKYEKQFFINVDKSVLMKNYEKGIYGPYEDCSYEEQTYD